MKSWAIVHNFSDWRAKYNATIKFMIGLIQRYRVHPDIRRAALRIVSGVPERDKLHEAAAVFFSFGTVSRSVRIFGASRRSRRRMRRSGSAPVIATVRSFCWPRSWSRSDLKRGSQSSPRRRAVNRITFTARSMSTDFGSGWTR